ncbi:hypothetical protein Q2K19_04510 [Micromonospora soli]|uniref:hypothetical protein n=1 Tax=Micromonospora sp. NBRC 110009 TaxID=3061627 RepID=UPI002671122B|nr:hypothetical protein [Micromonospora sp. NBRC 110009]WKT99765.1 hypothetical protein Q2K19_04510 [Micromonospora sp. NBRC 110009]
MRDEPSDAARGTAAQWLSAPDRESAWRWAEAARTARQAADDLHRLRGELTGHWRGGRGRDDADEVLRHLAHRMEDAYAAYRLVAEALAVWDRELDHARLTIMEALDEARRLGLTATGEGTVTAAGDAPMAVRAAARRLTAAVSEALAHADAARARATDTIATLPPPR